MNQQSVKMKAVVCPKYGPPEVLTIQELPKPAPRKNEVLIKILASTVNSGDARIRGRFYEIRDAFNAGIYETP